VRRYTRGKEKGSHSVKENTECVDVLGYDKATRTTVSYTIGYVQFVENLLRVVDFTKYLGFKYITLNDKSLQLIRYALEKDVSFANSTLQSILVPLQGISLIKTVSGTAHGVKESTPINSLHVQIVKDTSADQEDSFLWITNVSTVVNTHEDLMKEIEDASM